MSVSTRLRSLLERRIDPRPLALTRISVAIAALLKGFDLWLEVPAVVRSKTFRQPLLEHVPILSPDAVAPLMIVWLCAALLLLLGLGSRASAAVLSLLAFLLLLQDQELYANHFYLLALLCLLLAVAECEACLSLRAWRAGPRHEVAGWPVLLLEVQLSLVYGFGALAKLNASFLSGQVIAQSLRPEVSAVLASGGQRALSLATVALEVFLALGLWWPRTRALAAALGIVLHLGIVLGMGPDLKLLVFAIESVALYPLFFPSFFSRSRS